MLQAFSKHPGVARAHRQPIQAASGCWAASHACKLAWARLSPPIAERRNSHQDVAHRGHQFGALIDDFSIRSRAVSSQDVGSFINSR